MRVVLCALSSCLVLGWPSACSAAEGLFVSSSGDRILSGALIVEGVSVGSSVSSITLVQQVAQLTTEGQVAKANISQLQPPVPRCWTVVQCWLLAVLQQLQGDTNEVHARDGEISALLEQGRSNVSLLQVDAAASDTLLSCVQVNVSAARASNHALDACLTSDESLYSTQISALQAANATAQASPTASAAAFSAQSNLVVAESYNSRVLVVPPLATTATVAPAVRVYGES